MAPYDQHLTLDGVQLSESSMTLAEHRVLPQSVIYLRVDEPANGGDVAHGVEEAKGGCDRGRNGVGAAVGQEAWVASHREEGFKGIQN